MAAIDTAFRVAVGISLEDEVLISQSALDPSDGAGFDAPLGSLLLQKPISGEAQMWKKSGAGNTAWKKFGSKAHESTGIPDVTNDDVDTAAIGVTFDNGDLWIYTTENNAYICTNNSTGAAIWLEIGVTGGAAVGQTWKFDTGTTDADPGAKKFRFDNATQPSATFIYINQESNSGLDMTTFLMTLDTGDTIYVQESSDSTRAHLIHLTAPPTDATTYIKIPIAVDQSGVGDLRNNKDCFLVFNFSGTSGVDANAIHVNVPSEISGIASATPDYADYVVIEDASDSNNKKSTTIGGVETQFAGYKALVGASAETIDAFITESGGTVYCNVQKEGTGDITLIYSDGRTPFDCTPVAQVALTVGTDVAPQENWVFILKSTGSLTSNITGFPTAEHVPIGRFVVESAATVATKKVYKNHLYTDHILSTGANGHISHINDWIRSKPATWLNGVVQTLTITPGSPDTVIFTTTSGEVKQLHSHTFPAFSGTPDIYVTNDSVTQYTIVNDLADLLTDANGVSMSARYFSLVIWGVVNEETNECKLFLNLPTGSYNSLSGVTADTSRYTVYTIAQEYIGVGFLISELKLRHQTISGGTWTSIEEIDRRGQLPSTTAGGVGGVDTYAIHRDVDSEINIITQKTLPVTGDIIILEDSAASYAKKKADLGDLHHAIGAGASQIDFAFGGLDLPFLRANANVYEAIVRVKFSGTNKVGIPTGIKAVAYTRDGDTKFSDLRIYDLTNANIIAEKLNINGLAPTVWDFGTLSNLPTGEAVFEVQGRKAATDGNEAYISALTIEFS